MVALAVLHSEYFSVGGILIDLVDAFSTHRTVADIQKTIFMAH